MRVLLVEDTTIEALAIQRELAGREVRVATTLAGAQVLLSQPGWQPDVVVADLNLPDSEGVATLHALQASARIVPVVVSTGMPKDAIRRHVDLLLGGEEWAGTALPLRRPAAFGQQTIPLQRSEILAEIDRLTRDAIDAAVSQAIDKLMRRLGLTDEEGLQMAIRLARGWEAAKLRFLSTITTGFASACLLALGAGLMAMLREGGPR